MKHAQAQEIKAAAYVELKVAPMIDYCSECGMLYFPYKPTRKLENSLKIIEISPSSSGSDNSKKMVPMNVVTRAQKLKDAEAH